MRKLMLLGYGALLGIALLTQSCEDDPIFPNGEGGDSDTTWVNDSTDFDGNDDGNIDDSTNWDGGGNVDDSTDWNGGDGTIDDSTNWGGGDPGDSLGGN